MDQPDDLPDEIDVEDIIQPVLDGIDAIWQDDYERPRGLLTDTDRKFLWGIHEYAHEESAINRRKDIRERVEHGLLDLFYLSLITERDRARIFEQLELADASLHSAISTLVEFLYLGLDGDRTALEEFVASGVYNAEATNWPTLPHDPDHQEGDGRPGGPTDVDVEIDVSYDPSPDDVYERFQNGEADLLTPAELGVLLRSGKLDLDDLQAFTTDGNDDQEPAGKPP